VIMRDAQRALAQVDVQGIRAEAMASALAAAKAHAMAVRAHDLHRPEIEEALAEARAAIEEADIERALAEAEAELERADDHHESD